MEMGKLLAHYREFHWLQGLLRLLGVRDLSAVRSIRVQRIDLALIARAPEIIAHPNGGTVKEVIVLLARTGVLLNTVGEISCPPKPKRWWRRNPRPYTLHVPTETVGEALKRLGSWAQGVDFIVSFINYHDAGPDVVIYKAPKEQLMPK